MIPVLFVFCNGTVTSAATAVSVLSLIQAGGFNPTGPCVTLGITFDKDTYWGSTSAVTNATGALLTSGTGLNDHGVGHMSDTIPISQMFVYATGGDAHCTVYARFIA